MTMTIDQFGPRRLPEQSKRQRLTASYRPAKQRTGTPQAKPRTTALFRRLGLA